MSTYRFTFRIKLTGQVVTVIASDLEKAKTQLKIVLGGRDLEFYQFESAKPVE